MRDIIAGSLTGSTSLIGSIFMEPFARAVLAGLWIVTMYLIHRAGRRA